jgi:thiopeptide-type bacteriocin biosynthesis protein
MRSPLLPVRRLLDLLDPVSPPLSTNATIAGKAEDARTQGRAFTVAVERVGEKLREFASDPVIREALFVGSPAIHRALFATSPAAEGPHGTERRKLEFALYRYVARMATRSTPFGLFAGCSIGRLGETTRLCLEPTEMYRARPRLDNQLLCTVLEGLVDDRATRSSLRFMPTPSLYRAGGRLRYAKIPLTAAAEDQIFSLIDVEPNEILTLLLEAGGDAATPAAIARRVMDAYPRLKDDGATTLVDALIDEGLLVPAAWPPVTGEESAHAFVETLSAESTLAPIGKTLCNAMRALEDAARAPLGGALPFYEAAVFVLEKLPRKPETSALFQVDLVKPAAGATLGAAPVRELLRVASLLQAFAPRREFGSIARFRNRFIERYEQREVPLVEALDEETGLSFDEHGNGTDVPFLRDIRFPRASRDDASFRPRDRFLADMCAAGLRRGAAELEVTLADSLSILDSNATDGEPRRPPDAFVAHAMLLAASGADVDAGRFELYCPRLFAPSGMKTLARFCHADSALHAFVREHLAKEDTLAGEAIVADVVHLPVGRIANIMLRPNLRNYEIVCHGRSGARKELQIPVADLLVSVVGERIVLRSKRLGKRILPRITNAHSAPTDVSAPAYRFLYLVEMQDALASPGWEWGALEGSETLPRVRSERTILAPATWNFGESRLRDMIHRTGPQRMAAVARLRDEFSLPRWVAATEMDQVLPLNLEHPLCVEVLVGLASARKRLTLVEFEPILRPPLLKGNEGGYLQELTVPFVLAGAAPEARPRIPRQGSAPSPEEARVVAPTERRLAPGSHALYAKIFAGESSLDAILLQVVRPLVTRWRDRLEGWFFIRYPADGEHIRLRLFGDPDWLWREAVGALHEALTPFLASERVRRVQLDTYEREIERYGGLAGLRLSERIFRVDSEACLELIAPLADCGMLGDRWQLVLLGSDTLLADFGVPIHERLALMQDAVEGYAREFRVDKDLHHTLSKKARSTARVVEGLLGRGPLADAPLATRGRHIFARRSERLRGILHELEVLRARGELSKDLNSFILSYIHMHANRVFDVAPRAQEFVVYEFLRRAYQAALARASAVDRSSGSPEVPV